MSDSSYPVKFANARRDGFIPFSTSAKGKVVWAKDLGVAPVNTSWPATVLNWGERTVVLAYDRVIAFDSEGKALWSKVRALRTPSAVRKDVLYFKNGYQFIDALNSKDEAVLTSASFPGGTSDKIDVTFFLPREKDFVAVLYDADQNDHGQDGRPARHEPKITLVRNDYSVSYGSALHNFPGEPTLAPLFFEETLTLTVGNEAIRVNLLKDKEVSRFRLPKQSVEWSQDPDGKYTVLAQEGKHKALIRLSPEGKELWRWTDLNGQDEWISSQPPVRLPSGRMVALAGSRLIAVEDGKMTLSLDLSLPEQKQIQPGTFWVSALSDGALLIAREKTLILLSKDAKKVFSLELSHLILSPPLINSKGWIYAVTEKELVQVQ